MKFPKIFPLQILLVVFLVYRQTTSKMCKVKKNGKFIDRYVLVKTWVRIILITLPTTNSFV